MTLICNDTEVNLALNILTKVSANKMIVSVFAKQLTHKDEENLWRNLGTGRENGLGKSIEVIELVDSFASNEDFYSESYFVTKAKDITPVNADGYHHALTEQYIFELDYLTNSADIKIKKDVSIGFKIHSKIVVDVTDDPQYDNNIGVSEYYYNKYVAQKDDEDDFDYAQRLDHSNSYDNGAFVQFGGEVVYVAIEEMKALNLTNVSIESFCYDESGELMDFSKILSQDDVTLIKQRVLQD